MQPFSSSSELYVVVVCILKATKFKIDYLEMSTNAENFIKNHKNNLSLMGKFMGKIPNFDGFGL